MRASLIGLGLAIAVCGCDMISPAPYLPADAFVSNKPVVGPGVGQGVTTPGALVYDQQRKPPAPNDTPQPSISPTVRDVVRPTDSNPGVISAPATQEATTLPATQEAATQPVATTQGAPGETTGRFQWVGGVVAVVNDEPIYADKVLNTLERSLAAEARSSDEQRFKSVAEDLITKQVREFIENDLEYAAAKTELDKKDMQIATFVTGEWRKEQIRKAGGSEAIARQRAADDGQDFDELCKQQLRISVTRLYYQNKIFPLIQVTGSDMRQYYQANIRQFQKSSAAKYRVIFISSEATGSANAALEKAKSIYQRATGGESFETMAGQINDDPVLKGSHGRVGSNNGWMEKGEWVVEKVEAAVWSLKPGEVTAPIAARDGRVDGFWVARLEELRADDSKSFEDERVQDEIRELLRRQQFAKRREEHRRNLIEKAVIRENPRMVDVVMQMVMQRYHVWIGR